MLDWTIHIFSLWKFKINNILALKTLWIFIYIKCTAKPYYFTVIDTTVSSDNPLCFRHNCFRENIIASHDNSW